ncbi:hypothetical protein VL04_17395 [Chromobacterium violaceum]|uniref:hypothetical protein n=1 Tax=Chromobacterium violaceum TaxID=536 RepID=UPI0006544F99|nr:hypothetical protein [Chromobacterium violaceum]KMN48747.1 hypothetical protein VK93_14660 [Chromobacterium violaceum]KMN87842.1 hypothetical protein VL02_00655 [Chromobacterium violaceum]KMN89070.1 hypothetical protein VL04_17395 [Chromobacterium violaceum]KMO05445.1 hypothetical protein VL16_02640 [Chromobacterium violaceum]
MSLHFNPLGLLVFLFLVSMFGYAVYEMITAGTIHSKDRKLICTREETPVRFWLLVTGLSAIPLLMILVLLIKLVQ